MLLSSSKLAWLTPPDYCIVAFTVVLIISTVQWFIDGSKNFKGPRVDLEILQRDISAEQGTRRWDGRVSKPIGFGGSSVWQGGLRRGWVVWNGERRKGEGVWVKTGQDVKVKECGPTIPKFEDICKTSYQRNLWFWIDASPYVSAPFANRCLYSFISAASQPALESSYTTTPLPSTFPTLFSLPIQIFSTILPCRIFPTHTSPFPPCSYNIPTTRQSVPPNPPTSLSISHPSIHAPHPNP